MTYQVNAELQNALELVKVQLVELKYIAACFDISEGRVRGMFKSDHDDVSTIEPIEVFGKTYFVAENVREAADARKARLAQVELDRQAKAAEKAEKAEANAGPTKLQLQVLCADNGIRYSGRNRGQLMEALEAAKIELPEASVS